MFPPVTSGPIGGHGFPEGHHPGCEERKNDAGKVWVDGTGLVYVAEQGDPQFADVGTSDDCQRTALLTGSSVPQRMVVGTTLGSAGTAVPSPLSPEPRSKIALPPGSELLVFW